METNEKKEMTVEEILKVTISNLSSIQVPVGLIQQIAVPIDGNIRNLVMCLQKLEKKDSNEPSDEELKLGDLHLVDKENEDA